MGGSCSMSKRSSVAVIDDPDSIASRIESSKLTRKFDMQKESLSAVPREVFGAVHLRIFIFNSNVITEIPPAVSALTNLEEFQIFDNKLRSIPGQIGFLVRLQILNLSNNSITFIPKEIGNLTGLTELLLWGNKLVKLPDEIQNLSKLFLLDISFNKLDDVTSGIGGLSQLQELKLVGNCIRSLPRTVSSLVSLFHLDLSNNNLVSIPVELCNCGSLVKLNLKRNIISELPNSMEKLVHLAELNLLGNELSHLPSSVCEMPVLKRLILTDNKLIDLPPKMGHIRSLNLILLDGNPLTNLCEDIFSAPLLATIHTRGHKYVDIPEAIVNAKNLSTVYLTNGAIERIPNSFTVSLERICKLDLSNNNIAEFPEVCEGLANLQELKLFRNRLTGLPQTLSHLTNLQLLNIHSNQIESLPDLFQRFSKLKKLFIAYNRIKSLPSSVTSLKNLIEIHASHNPITEIPAEYSSMTTLKCLWMGSCDFSDRSYLDVINGMSCISVLDISNNKLEELPVGFLLNTRQLHILDLSENRVTSIPQDFATSSRLKVFDLTSRQLRIGELASMSEKIATLNKYSFELMRLAETVPESLGIEVGFSTYLGRRNDMEDQICICHDIPGLQVLVAVFDGHDGVSTAQHLKDAFPNALKKHLETSKPTDALKKTYIDMDSNLKESTSIASGSTSSTVLITKTQIFVANAGDSRAIICRRGGQVERVSVDHKPYNPDEHGRIRDMGGFVTEDGRISGVLAVSRSFGDLHLQPSVTPEPFLLELNRSEKDEWLIVASDGLWDTVSDEDAAKMIEGCESCRAAALILKDMAFLSESTDNISIVVVRLRS